MPLVIALLLGLSAIFIVIYPLMGLERLDGAHADGDAPLSELGERERTAKQSLRDVEFDYALGNLEQDDYSELREVYEGQALAALKTRYEREQRLDALIERQLTALRTDEARKSGRRVASKAGGRAGRATGRKSARSVASSVAPNVTSRADRETTERDDEEGEE